VGQGVTDVIAQVARQELGIDDVAVTTPSTTEVGSAGSSSASRMTWMAAGAVRLACHEALAERERTGGDVDVERVYRHLPTFPFACAAMKVVAEVDVELGLTRIVWIGTAQDVGKALNPLAVHGQIEGGTAQGIGLALMEEIQTTGGLITNASFTDYLIPTALDVPPIEAVLVEDPEPDGPYGLKGVGEPPTVVSTAAVVSALRNATGRELARVPVRPDDIAL
jgi:CO/xanthine dehydrogenase Mo-binding subunit